MKFKTWYDQYLFIKEYATVSCISCQYGGEIEENEFHDDSNFKRMFCRKYLSMVEFAFQFLCAGWENDGKTLKDYGDCKMYKFDDHIDDHIVDVLDDDSKTWSFEEIKEVIEGYEEVKE